MGVCIPQTQQNIDSAMLKWSKFTTGCEDIDFSERLLCEQKLNQPPKHKNQIYHCNNNAATKHPPPTPNSCSRASDLSLMGNYSNSKSQELLHMNCSKIMKTQKLLVCTLIEIEELNYTGIPL